MSDQPSKDEDFTPEEREEINRQVTEMIDKAYQILEMHREQMERLRNEGLWPPKSERK